MTHPTKHTHQVSELDLAVLTGLIRALLNALRPWFQAFDLDPHTALLSAARIAGVQLELTSPGTLGLNQHRAVVAGGELEELGGDPAPELAPPSGRKAPTPQELEGYQNLLRGRTGTVSRAAGPGSWFVVLTDGSEVVLPTHALYLVGAEAPGQKLEADPERVAGWKAMLFGRTGYVLNKTGDDCYVVQLNDGCQVVLPEAALPLAGCSLEG